MSPSTDTLSASASASGEKQETTTTPAATTPATNANDDFKKPTSATSVKSESEGANTGGAAEATVSEEKVKAHETKNGEK